MPNPRDESTPGKPNSRRKKRSAKNRRVAECWRCRREIDLLFDGIEDQGRMFHIVCHLHTR